MTLVKRFSLFAFSAALVSVVLFGSSSAASAAPAPALPNGQELHVLGFYNPKQHVTVNLRTGIATAAYSVTGLATVGESEGAGLDVSTGNRWAIGADCSLWSLNEDGTTTQRFNLVTTTGLADLQACYTLMLNQDGTAYTTADVTSGNEDSLLRFNLSDGSLVANSVKNTAEIAGLAKDPTTGDVWASVISNHDSGAGFPQGLYKINLATGALDVASQILRSNYNDEDAWDMTFDSSGRLWMLTWGDDSTLVSLDPDAVNPVSTISRVAYVLRSGDNVSMGSDAMWIEGVSSLETAQPALANTGFDLIAVFAFGSVFLALGLLTRVSFARRQR